MSDQLLINVVSATVPAGATNYAVAHGLRSNDLAVSPTLVMPAAQSEVTVASFDTTNLYLANPSGDPIAVTFRVERGLSTEVDAEALTPFVLSTGTGKSGVTPLFSNADFNYAGVLNNSATTIATVASLVVEDGVLSIGTQPKSGFRLSFKVTNAGGTAVDFILQLGVTGGLSTTSEWLYTVPAGQTIDIPQIAYRGMAVADGDTTAVLKAYVSSGAATLLVSGASFFVSQ